MDSQCFYIVRVGWWGGGVVGWWGGGVVGWWGGGVVGWWGGGGISIFTNKTSMYDKRRSYNNGYYCPLCPL